METRQLREALLERSSRGRRARGLPLTLWLVLGLLVLGGGGAAIHFALSGASGADQTPGILAGTRDAATTSSDGPALDLTGLGLDDASDTAGSQSGGASVSESGEVTPEGSSDRTARASSLALAGTTAPGTGTDQPATAPEAPAVTPDAPLRAPVSRLQEADALLQAGNYAAARDLIEDQLAETTAPDARAGILYRLGIVARYEKREADAQARWSEAYNAAPRSAGGRLAAVAIADTAFARNAVPNPTDEQYSRWELIRDTYSDALGLDGAPFLPGEARARVVRNLHVLNDRLIFSPAPVSGAVYHTVQGGEYLSRIAGHYGVHYLSIAVVNRIDPNRLRAGRTLKILKGTCEVLVDRSDLTLTWYLDGRFVRQVSCCIGPGEKTPAGTYEIVSQEEKPAWPDPETGEVYPYGHPKNILGTHWLGLEGNGTSGLGIHGTTVPDSIPGRTSAGCIRIHNDHVRELYGFARLGTRVVIRD